MKNTDYSEIIERYNNGESLNSLSKIYNINLTTIRYNLIKRGIKIRTVKESVQPFFYKEAIILSKSFKDLLIGCLLGDGGLRLKSNSITPYFNYTDKHFEVVEYIRAKCIEEGLKCAVIRQNKANNVFSFETECREEFNELYNLFYPKEILSVSKQKRKILPTIKLNPLILLWWYLGDGSSCRQSKSNTHKGVIACKNYNENILEQLNEITHSICRYYIYKTNNGNSCGQYHIPHKGLINLLSYIGHCPFECYRYKWATISY